MATKFKLKPLFNKIFAADNEDRNAQIAALKAAAKKMRSEAETYVDSCHFGFVGTSVEAETAVTNRKKTKQETLDAVMSAIITACEQTEPNINTALENSGKTEAEIDEALRDLFIGVEPEDLKNNTNDAPDHSSVWRELYDQAKAATQPAAQALSTRMDVSIKPNSNGGASYTFPPQEGQSAAADLKFIANNTHKPGQVYSFTAGTLPRRGKRISLGFGDTLPERPHDLDSLVREMCAIVNDPDKQGRIGNFCWHNGSKVITLHQHNQSFTDNLERLQGEKSRWGRWSSPDTTVFNSPIVRTMLAIAELRETKPNFYDMRPGERDKLIEKMVKDSYNTYPAIGKIGGNPNPNAATIKTAVESTLGLTQAPSAQYSKLIESRMKLHTDEEATLMTFDSGQFINKAELKGSGFTGAVTNKIQQGGKKTKYKTEHRQQELNATQRLDELSREMEEIRRQYIALDGTPREHQLKKKNDLNYKEIRHLAAIENVMENGALLTDYGHYRLEQLRSTYALRQKYLEDPSNSTIPAERTVLDLDPVAKLKLLIQHEMAKDSTLDQRAALNNVQSKHGQAYGDFLEAKFETARFSLQRQQRAVARSYKLGSKNKKQEKALEIVQSTLSYGQQATEQLAALKSKLNPNEDNGDVIATLDARIKTIETRMQEIKADKRYKSLLGTASSGVIEPPKQQVLTDEQKLEQKTHNGDDLVTNQQQSLEVRPTIPSTSPVRSADQILGSITETQGDAKMDDVLAHEIVACIDKTPDNHKPNVIQAFQTNLTEKYPEYKNTPDVIQALRERVTARPDLTAIISQQGDPTAATTQQRQSELERSQAAVKNTRKVLIKVLIDDAHASDGEPTNIVDNSKEKAYLASVVTAVRAVATERSTDNPGSQEDRQPQDVINEEMTNWVEIEKTSPKLRSFNMRTKLHNMRKNLGLNITHNNTQFDPLEVLQRTEAPIENLVSSKSTPAGDGQSATHQRSGQTVTASDHRQQPSTDDTRNSPRSPSTKRPSYADMVKRRQAPTTPGKQNQQGKQTGRRGQTMQRQSTAQNSRHSGQKNPRQ